jgi:hypothetical protein
MTSAVVELDHLMIKVDSLKAAAEKFSRMGFDVTPESRIESLGVANRLVLLWPRRPGVANFLELMSVPDPGNVDPTMAQVLSAGEGIKMIVHLAADIEKFVATVREREPWVDPIWDIRREWQTPDGERQTIRFRVTKPVPGEAPFTINAYQPNVIGQYLQDRFRHHANGARHVAAVTGIAAAQQFAPTVAYFEALYGIAAQRAGEGIAEIKPRDVTLRIVTATSFAGLYPEIGPAPLRLPCLAAVTIEVSDLEGVATLLAANEVSHVRRRQPAGIIVGPHDACGVTFEFVST